MKRSSNSKTKKPRYEDLNENMICTDTSAFLDTLGAQLTSFTISSQAKISGKVYKLTVPQIKKVCDFFSLDRSGIHDKEALVNLLLDFLGKPDDKFVKGSKSKSSAAKSKASKKTTTKADEYDDLEEEEDDNVPLKKGGMPTDEQLRKWVRAYVRCFNMEKATIKHALEIAGDKFDVDLSEKKGVLKQLLTEEM